MQLIIAEKPSVARLLAQTLEPTNISSNNGYLQGQKFTYTWAIGHLVSLARAETYCDNPWDLKVLPILPNDFKLQVNDKTKKQFYIIKDLISKSKTIINAADAGREGELIFRYILELSKLQPGTDIKRLWISDFSNKSIVNGFSNLKKNSDFDNLYASAKARAQSDWLYGINATIGLSKTINNGKLYSLGRVQTPTFCMITKRYLEHINFKKEPYFLPFINLKVNDITFKANYKGDTIKDKSFAQQLLLNLPDSIICTERHISTKQIKTPLCFDLTSLQIEANKKFSLTAQQTLDLAQELYEKDRVISYPRTDSKYLSANQMDDIKSILKDAINNYPQIESHINLELNKKSIFNDAKVSDHHAIIPISFSTNTKDWPTNKQNIYKLISAQFFKAFSYEATSETLACSFEHEKHCFSCSETFYPKPGFKFFEGYKTEGISIPSFNQNDSISIFEKGIENKETQPKPLYTEASLLKAMERCGQEFDIDELPIEIKRKGIGTPATRASIIETIIKREYISRKGKKLIPSDKGSLLYNEIKNISLADVKLTGRWEEQLHLIAEGKVDYFFFLDKVKNLLQTKLIEEVKRVNPEPFKIQKKTYNSPCLKCSGQLIDSPKAIYCDNKSCDFVLFKNAFGKKLSDKIIKELLNQKIVFVEGLKSFKTGKKFSANVFIDKKTEFKLKIHSFKK